MIRGVCASMTATAHGQDSCRRNKLISGEEWVFTLSEQGHPRSVLTKNHATIRITGNIDIVGLFAKSQKPRLWSL